MMIMYGSKTWAEQASGGAVSCIIIISTIERAVQCYSPDTLLWSYELNLL